MAVSTPVYRKPTQTDLYLQWDSHHTLSAKYSVVSTLHHMARAVHSGPQLLQKEEEHLHKVLVRCKYRALALNRMKLKIRAHASKNNNKRSTNTSSSTTSNNQGPHMVVPYTKGQRESLMNAWSKHGVQVCFRRDRIIRSLLVAPKDKDPITKKSEAIYRYKCDRVECDKAYIAESSRTFGERFKEHWKAHAPIYTHFNNGGHTTIDNFSIVRREDQYLIRTIKEILNIMVHKSISWTETQANTICLVYGMR